mgnify:CR=1 FL=1
MIDEFQILKRARSALNARDEIQLQKSGRRAFVTETRAGRATRGRRIPVTGARINRQISFSNARKKRHEFQLRKRSVKKRNMSYRYRNVRKKKADLFQIRKRAPSAKK